jgi:hypothetical protein
MDYRLRAGLVAVPTIAAAVEAASRGRWGYSKALLVIGIGGLALLALIENVRLWREPPSIAAAKEAGALNATLMAMVYACGSAAIAGMYYLTDLSWYHAYQYALYLAVPAVLAGLYAWRIETIDIAGRERPLRTGKALAAVQLAAMLAIIALLIASGKAPGTRPDWAANTVFLAGAAALALISALALMAQRRLRP